MAYMDKKLEQRWQLRAAADKYRNLYDVISPIYEDFDYSYSSDMQEAEEEVMQLLEKLHYAIVGAIEMADKKIIKLDNENK